MTNPLRRPPGFLLLAGLLLGCAPATQPASTSTPEVTTESVGSQLYIVGDGVRLRAGPGTNHEVVGMLSRGEPVTVLYGAGSWCAIARTTEDATVDTVWVYANLVGSLEEAQGR